MGISNYTFSFKFIDTINETSTLIKDKICSYSLPRLHNICVCVYVYMMLYACVCIYDVHTPLVRFFWMLYVSDNSMSWYNLHDNIMISFIYLLFVYQIFVFVCYFQINCKNNIRVNFREEWITKQNKIKSNIHWHLSYMHHEF